MTTILSKNNDVGASVGKADNAPSSPKRNFSNRNEFWYDYYAGYSPAFVREIISRLKLQPGDTVMDPWIGSGTTARAAQEANIHTVGFDINPVMIVVTKAGCLEISPLVDSVTPVGKDIIKKARRSILKKTNSRDPLLTWFDQETTLQIRKVERGIRSNFPEIGTLSSKLQINQWSTISDTAAFFYTALFCTVRSMLHPFEGSNPTWIKTPSSANELISNPGDICILFEQSVEFLRDRLYTLSQRREQALAVSTTFQVASSLAMPQQSLSIDAVISSPPYCTRIDYATATKPELAVLGIDFESEFDLLRSCMIGTNSINVSTPLPQSVWGESCNEFLGKVQEHSSKASKTYYWKYFVQYFDGISRSLVEIDRILKRNCACVLVVQDSYYKELHNNLPLIYTEMGNQIGWEVESQWDFTWDRSMANINPRSREYRRTISTIESAIIFRKRSRNAI